MARAAAVAVGAEPPPALHELPPSLVLPLSAMAGSAEDEVSRV